MVFFFGIIDVEEMVAIKYDDEYKEYEEHERKLFKRLTKLDKLLLLLGAIFSLSSITTLIIFNFIPNSYSLIALSTIMATPILWSALCVLYVAAFNIKAPSKVTTVFFRFIIIIVLMGGIKATYDSPFSEAIKDFQAVHNDELLHTYGFVIDSHIRTSTRNNKRAKSRDRYYQHFTFVDDNDEHLEFSYSVRSKDDYEFILYEYYNIIALPYSKTIVDYTLVK